ncbi:MAG: hypothetical protein IKL06_06230 [Lachnospiraceae bacterium]|nr:hypothetical protein [Lachnospiraceae bacterium]
MKKTLALLLTLVMSVSVFAGCSGTAVVEKENPNKDTEVATEVAGTEITDTEALVDSTEVDGTSSSTSEPRPVKTGLSVTTALSGTDATADADGTAQADITIVAVTVDADGKINSCVIDQIQGKNTFSATGEITTTDTAFLSKNELGSDYGMVAWGGAIAEWDAQAAALAEYVVGKTAEEVKGISIVEGGKAGDADLASSATMAIAGFIDPIVTAVNNAQDLGAAHWDTLQLVSVTAPSDNANATADKAGTASAYATVAAVTTHYDEITSCVIDAVQANVNFDAAGKITTDFTALVPTKNEKGADYGMVAWGGAIAEWNEQAASFASYVTGKTISEVAGIAVDETGKTTDADLLASVTIKIGDFKALIEKLAQ